VDLSLSGLFLEHLAASDPEAEHFVIWDQAGFHPDPKLHAVPTRNWPTAVGRWPKPCQNHNPPSQENSLPGRSQVLAQGTGCRSGSKQSSIEISRAGPSSRADRFDRGATAKTGFTAVS